MSDLAEFLLARFDDDTAEPHPIADAVRTLIDTTIKREIVEKWLDGEPYGPQDTRVLRLLAAQYAEHPDFRADWALVPVTH